MTLEALLGRYSLGGKDLVESGPSDQELDAIAKAALQAPDHGELTPFRLVVVKGEARKKMAELFVAYAQSIGKSPQSCEIERSRALNVPVSIAIIARVDMSHPIVPAHEQWICIGGAITNILNAIHLLGYAGKMLSGGKVRDRAIADAFCHPGETLVGWIAVGTAARALQEKTVKPLDQTLSFF